MIMDRRAVLLGLGASGVLPLAAFADRKREPAFVTCCRRADGRFAAAVLDEDAQLLFTETLDGRGHDAAIAPDGRLAVVFARRPGRFALVLDLSSHRRLSAFAPPDDRHFYGHGFFSPDGHLLYATENDFETERGVLGVYDVALGFRRIAEIDTHGIGPHEALFMRNGRTIAVANGGIATHPDYPRQKLNLAEMEPSLVYLDCETGDLIDRVTLTRAFHQLSIRHMTEAGDGTIWFGGQYEGAQTDPVDLVGTHETGKDIALIPAPRALYAAMNQYIGSVAVSADGARVATTSPRGGRLVIWDTKTKNPVEMRAIDDVCGAAAYRAGFLLSDGAGGLWHPDNGLAVQDGWSWDNHIVAVPKGLAQTALRGREPHPEAAS